MKSVRNGMRALALFDADTPDIGVSEVGRALGLTRSSVSRLMAALAETGLVQQDAATRRYRPGPLAARLGALYRPDALLETVRRAARDLAAETGHSTWVAVLEGAQIVVLDNVHGGYPVRYVVEPGARLPAHTTAIGKALLARLDDADVAARFAAHPPEAVTGASVDSLPRLFDELARTRARGIAVGDQENFVGIKSFALARTGDDRRMIGLGLSFPVANLDPGREELLIAALRRHADVADRQSV